MKVHTFSVLKLVVVLCMYQPAQGALVSGQDIIAAPPSVIDDPPGAVNTAQQAFDEAQDVELPRDIQVDQNVIPRGTRVDSHMVFLNTIGTAATTDQGVVWTFDGPILGVMSDVNGALEAATSDILGAPGTVYPSSFGNRGLETVQGPCPSDSYRVSGNSITVNMCVAEPGDWIRVVTAIDAIPIPTATGWGLAALALLLLVAARLHLGRHA